MTSDSKIALAKEVMEQLYLTAKHYESRCHALEDELKLMKEQNAAQDEVRRALDNLKQKADNLEKHEDSVNRCISEIMDDMCDVKKAVVGQISEDDGSATARHSAAPQEGGASSDGPMDSGYYDKPLK